jgi:SagB-type dehydrogenase family enzyme
MTALAYHETTKHHFNRFARSAGYLDWATQPDPFRRYAGASLIPLSRDPVPATAPAVPYEALYDGRAPVLPVDFDSVSELLRCSMGLSAWKQYQSTRWALRVNPSSGNLHPTEAYIVWNGAVCHYAPREHALEQRALLVRPGPSDRPALGRVPTHPAPDQWLLVGFSSIFWREAWKYGERAFRYCQHDLGHALGALRLSAARLGWQVHLLTTWSDAEVATLLGLDRDDDFANAEREAPECVALVAPPELDVASAAEQARQWLDAVRSSPWTGAANRLSPSHVAWPIIERVAEATEYPGPIDGTTPTSSVLASVPASPASASAASASPVSASPVGVARVERADAAPAARAIMLQRRSAVAFDGRTSLPLATFQSMLARLQPGQAPWDIVPWPSQVHLAVFVHRVDGLVPGIYAVLRDAAVRAEWQAAMRPQFLWESVDDRNGLFLLLPFDMMWPAMRVSCDQDIAGDGFFSLGMVAPVRNALRTHGEWFYRRLFWEAGLIGQVLYLEAEAAGARGTGIGCFFDDAVHELLGLPLGSTEATSGDGPTADWQSLYHFSMGMPVEDGRLTTDPGYEWEA